MIFFKKQNGFTLVETLVAIGIFAILSTIIASIFFNINNLQQNTASFQRLQNEGRYILEKLAREIRGRELNYPLEGTNPQTQLIFRQDENGESVSIIFNAPNLVFINGVGSADLNASDVEVTDMKFFVLPTAEDQWGEAPSSNTQSRVTILLKLKNKVSNPKYQKEITLQTTISSKIYKR
ncbi:MAG: prepilin-type N-terminal cleavage/methylation domain-containing protein [Patescibacteria group bacterium]